MGKGKFIAGTILGVLSVASGIITMICLYGVSQIAKGDGGMGAAVAGIVIIVFGVSVFLAVQIALGIGAEIFLWINFRYNGFAKRASMIIAIICAVVMAASIGYIVFLQLADGEKTQAVAYTVTNILKI